MGWGAGRRTYLKAIIGGGGGSKENLLEGHYNYSNPACQHVAEVLCCKTRTKNDLETGLVRASGPGQRPLRASLSGTFPPTDEGCHKPVLGACLGPRMTQRLYDDDDVMLNVLRCQLTY